MDLITLDEALAYLNGKDVFRMPIYESLQNEFDMSVDLFLAETEMIESLSGFITESVEVINEGVKETIMSYLSKVMAAIQKAWDNFKAKIKDTELRYLDKTVKPVLDNTTKTFEVKNFKKYDYTKFDSIRLKEFNYEQMKPSLDSVDNFIKTNYPNIPLEAEGGKLDLAMNKALNLTTTDIVCDKQQLTEIFDFCRNTVYDLKDNINKDIDTLNNSKNKIQEIATTIINSEQPTTESTNMASQSAYLEADTDANGSNDSSKMQFVDNDGETSTQGSSEEKNNRKTIVKAITTYMTASTKILTCKMRIVNKAKINGYAILTHLVGSTKGSEAKENVTNKAKAIKNKVVTKVNDVK